MFTRDNPDGGFVKNPSGCCYSWEIHDGHISGDCYNTAHVDWRALPDHLQRGTPFPPTEDERERWGTYLKLRESVEKMRQEA